MSDLSPQAVKALFYFGEIEAGTLAGESTAQIWDRIRAQAAAMGRTDLGISAIAVSELRGYANRIRTTTRNLANGTPEFGIEASMIAAAPWARDLGARNDAPMYQARFEHTFTDNGIENTAWRTVMFTGQLPASIGELYDALDQDAQGMADSYGITHGSIGSISLLAV